MTSARSRLIESRGDAPAQFDAVLAADPENIEAVVDAVSAGARGSGLDQRSASEVALAACEAVTNIIIHALGSDPQQSFRVCVSRADDALVVRFEDRGPPFDPESVTAADVCAPLAERPIGGLGWLLIRRHCDEVRMERVAETNILTLVRRRKT